MPARREHHRVVAGAETSRGASGSERAQRLEGRAAHRHRLEPRRRLEADRRHELVEQLRASGARASTDTVTRAGTTFTAFGSTSTTPTVATAPSRAQPPTCSTKRAAFTSASSRASIGVVPAWSARPSKTTAPRAWPAIAVTMPSGSPRALQHRPLLDVQLEERVGPLRELLAPQRSGLLGAEGHDRQRRVRQPLGRLDPGEDAEHAVVPAAVRHRVEVRARPDARRAAPADQVPCAVDLDREPRLSHPPGGERVRLVLQPASSPAGARRSRGSARSARGSASRGSLRARS